MVWLKRRTAIIVVTWSLLAVIASALGWVLVRRDLDNEFRAAQQTALNDAAIVSRAYAQNLFRSLESIDQLSLFVKYGYEASGGKLELNHISELARNHDSEMFVTIVDERGRPITSTLPSGIKADLSDEPFFVIQKRRPERRNLYIGQQDPYIVPGGNVFPFSRALLKADGSFGGIVLVTVRPSYFINSFDQVTMKDKGFLAILADDGGLRLVRLGKTIAQASLEEGLKLADEIKGEQGAKLLNGFPDRRPRYAAWSHTAGYNMIALAGLDQDEALVPFHEKRREALNDARTTTFGLLALTVLAIIIHLSMARRNEQMARLASTYRTATEGGLEGFFIATPVTSKDGTVEDFLISDCNSRGAQYLKYRSEQLKGRKLSELFHGESLQQTLRMLKSALREGEYEGEAELSQFGGVEGMWVHLKVSRPENDLAVTMRDITSTKAHVTELERRGFEDALTNLPNRHWLNSYLPGLLTHLQENRQMATVLFIDLDGFKAVNDTFGHETGDALLRHAGHRLMDAVRPHDRVVRLGGDEFLVVLERIASRDEAARVAKRIVEDFRMPFMTDKGEVNTCASVGLAVFPDDAQDASALLQAADSAMYSVKASGKCNYRFYDKRLAEAERERQALERDLRRALESDELVVYYQPRIAPGTGKIKSMEALVRWQHPRRGLLPPLEFVPLAEEAALIVPLGERVTDKVCADLARWRDGQQAVLPVSLNVSALQLHGPRFEEYLRNALQKYGLPASLIEVEVTESAVTDAADPRVARCVAGLRELGCKLVVDDFGTGYSSLSQLQDLDFDALKIDRAFTDRLAKTERGTALFEAIIQMAHALDMRVVAEGVETREQLDELTRLGCDEVQGFYFARPAPAENSERFLAEGFVV